MKVTAHEIVEATKKLRELQSEYFATQDKTVLGRCKNGEKYLDGLIAQYEKDCLINKAMEVTKLLIHFKRTAVQPRKDAYDRLYDSKLKKGDNWMEEEEEQLENLRLTYQAFEKLHDACSDMDSERAKLINEVTHFVQDIDQGVLFMGKMPMELMSMQQTMFDKSFGILTDRYRQFMEDYYGVKK